LLPLQQCKQHHPILFLLQFRWTEACVIQDITPLNNGLSSMSTDTSAHIYELGARRLPAMLRPSCPSKTDTSCDERRNSLKHGT
jgi:hypothetical protein